MSSLATIKQSKYLVFQICLRCSQTHNSQRHCGRDLQQQQWQWLVILLVIKFVSSVLWKLSKNDLVPHFRGFYNSDGCSSRLLHPFINLYLPSIQNTCNPKIWTSPSSPLIFLRPATVYLCSKFSFCSCWFSSLSVVDLERETETEIFVSYERFTCLLQLPCAFGPPSYLHWIVE